MGGRARLLMQRVAQRSAQNPIAYRSGGEKLVIDMTRQHGSLCTQLGEAGRPLAAQVADCSDLRFLFRLKQDAQPQESGALRAILFKFSVWIHTDSSPGCTGEH